MKKKISFKKIASIILCSPCLLLCKLGCIDPNPCGTERQRKRQARREARRRRNATLKGKCINGLNFLKDVPKYLCICAVCWPCFLCELGKECCKENPDVKRSRLRKEGEPRELGIRKRELSFSSGDGSIGGENNGGISRVPRRMGFKRKESEVREVEIEEMAETGPSAFLKLPVEIRRQIIEEVIGKDVLHLVQLHKRLGHVRCPMPFTEKSTHHKDLARYCIALPWVFDCTLKNPRNARVDSSLALLKTCRQLYTEAIPILYTSNTFCINAPITLVLLARTVLPQRLASIHHLQISWKQMCHPTETDSKYCYPDDLATWNSMWDIIETQMVGLRSLKFRIEPNERSSSHHCLRNPLWEIETRVRGLQEFEIEVPESMEGFVREVEGRVRESVCSPREWNEVIT